MCWWNDVQLEGKRRGTAQADAITLSTDVTTDKKKKKKRSSKKYRAKLQEKKSESLDPEEVAI